MKPPSGAEARTRRRWGLTAAAFGVVFLGILVARDIIFVHDSFLLVGLGLFRAILAVVSARAIRLYTQGAEESELKRALRLVIVAVVVLDLFTYFTRPRHDLGGLMISVLVLIGAYLLPCEDCRFRNITLALYGVGIVLILFTFKHSRLTTKLLIASAVFLTDIGASWAAAHRWQVDLPRARPQGQGEDYLALVKRKVQALTLSEREKEVAIQILLGEGRSEIAAKLYVSDETIKKHAANIYAKLGVSSRSEFFKLVLSDQ